MPHQEIVGPSTPIQQPKRSVLSRVAGGIGLGALSFFRNVPVDDLRAQALEDEVARQTAPSRVRQQENVATIQQQTIDANNAEIEKQQQTQQLVGVVQGGNAQESRAAADRLFQLNPELADTLFENMGATSSAQREDASRRASAILQTAPNDREAVIRQQAETLRAEGRNPSDTLSLIGQSPEDQDRALNIIQSAALSTKEFAAGVAGAETRALQERGVAVAERGIELREDELTAARGLSETARLTKQAEAGLKTEEGLRKELNTLLKDFFQVADANARVLAAGINPSAAGDLALIFNYMKLLDPGSTVREGEFATAQNSASVPQRVVSLYNRIVDGQRLSGPQREDFLARAESLFGAAQGEAQKTADAFERIATNAGVNVNNVLATFQERAGVVPAGASADMTDDELKAALGL